jgi:hypothetical protein
LAAALVVFGVATVAAGPVDPALRFRQLRTAHFTIYFHAGEESLAGRLASIVEEVRLEVGAAFQTAPPGMTHVILTDQSEVANGWATPIPRDTVFLYATAPSGAEFIGNTEDWLRLVFTHEFVHIVHLDRSGGWARVARGVFGRTPLVFPNLWLPQWQVEGIATWFESTLTGAGRRSAGDFRAIERVTARERRPIPLDRASGGLVSWPDGYAAYAAGLGFHEYLADRFGDASFGRLTSATARRLPFLGLGAYRRVFGQPLPALWRDYSDELAKTVASDSFAHTPATRLTHGRSVAVTGPRVSPGTCTTCPLEVVYTVRTQDGFPSLRRVGIDGGSDRELTPRYLGDAVGLGSSLVVFDQLQLRRNIGLYSDLYVLDRSSGRVQRLTDGARLRDPDLSPDGRSIAAVRESGGRRELVIAHVQPDASGRRLSLGVIDTIVSIEGAQFSTPRWSPSGSRLAVERRRPAGLPDVVIVEPATKRVVRTFADVRARIVTPTWHPDGDRIIAAASFDAESFDLYEFPLDEAAPIRRLTRTDGALWPDISADGRTVAYSGYTADGYELFTTPYAPFETPRALRPAAEGTAAGPPGPATGWPVERYSPWGTIAPTSWTPSLSSDAELTRAGGVFGGADVLGRHAYAVDLRWIAGAPDGVALPDRAWPDWEVAYAYTRWQPSFFGSASRTLDVDVVRDATTGVERARTFLRREFQSGVFWPIVRVRHNSQMLASLAWTDTRAWSERDQDYRLVSGRLAVAHDTSQIYGYSISREHGVDIGSTIELSRRGLGSQADSTTATFDGRAYVQGAVRHHVIALRAAAGTSTGDDLGRQSFTLGEVAASPSVIDFGADALGLFRGRRRAGRHVFVSNVEYRLPLATIERGVRAWPLMLKTVHASVFADAGRVSGGSSRQSGWSTSGGGELSADGVAGYSLPFVATIGAGWNRDADKSGAWSVFARLGRSF